MIPRNYRRRHIGERPDGIAKTPTEVKKWLLIILEFKKMSDTTEQYLVERARRITESQRWFAQKGPRHHSSRQRMRSSSNQLYSRGSLTHEKKLRNNLKSSTSGSGHRVHTVKTLHEHRRQVC
jgi:hypothetical protein